MTPGNGGRSNAGFGWPQRVQVISGIRLLSLAKCSNVSRRGSGRLTTKKPQRLSAAELVRCFCIELTKSRSSGRARRSVAASVFDLGEPEELEQPDVGPANVELEPARRKPRGLRVGVVVVVQLFTAEPDGDRCDVATLVLDLEVAIAERVSDSIDDSRRPERAPEHLHAPDDRPQ